MDDSPAAPPPQNERTTSTLSSTATLKHKRRYCKVEGCHRVVKSQGVCQRHGAKPRKCKVINCTKQAQGNYNGMCKTHFREYGGMTPLEASKMTTMNRSTSTMSVSNSSSSSSNHHDHRHKRQQCNHYQSQGTLVTNSDTTSRMGHSTTTANKTSDDADSIESVDSISSCSRPWAPSTHSHGANDASTTTTWTARRATFAKSRNQEQDDLQIHDRAITSQQEPPLENYQRSSSHKYPSRLSGVLPVASGQQPQQCYLAQAQLPSFHQLAQEESIPRLPRMDTVTNASDALLRDIGATTTTSRAVSSTSRLSNHSSYQGSSNNNNKNSCMMTCEEWSAGKLVRLEEMILLDEERPTASEYEGDFVADDTAAMMQDLIQDEVDDDNDDDGYGIDAKNDTLPPSPSPPSPPTPL